MMGYGNLSQQILLNELPTDERDLFSMISTADPEAYQRASDLMYAIQGGNKERGTGSPYSRLREMAYVGQLRGRQDELAEQKAEAMRRAMSALQTFSGNQQPMSMEDYMAKTGMNPNDIGEPIVPPEQRTDYLGRWGAEMSKKASQWDEEGNPINTFTNADLLPYELAGVRSKPERPLSRADVMLQLSQAGVPAEYTKMMFPEAKEDKITAHITMDEQGNPVYARESGKASTTRATKVVLPEERHKGMVKDYRDDVEKIENSYMQQSESIRKQHEGSIDRITNNTYMLPADKEKAIADIQARMDADLSLLHNKKAEKVYSLVKQYKDEMSKTDPNWGNEFLNQYNNPPNKDTDYFTKDLGESKGTVTPQSQPSPQPKGVPQVGEVRGGWRFKGGNPASPSSWEKV